MPADSDFLLAVYDVQAKGYAGLLTGRYYTRRQARRLELEGLLAAEWMDVTDTDGNLLEGAATRKGYMLTQAGLDTIPEDDRWAGNVDVAEDE